METALLVLGERDIPVITDARIQEIGFGTYEGRRVRDAKGEITDPKFFAFFRDPGNFTHRRAERAFRICCAYRCIFRRAVHAQRMV